MRYIKAEEVLPGELIQEIWQYVDGVTLYIPRKPENRRNWGSGTPYRRELETRNREIREEFGRGMSVPVLAERYHLSEKSIGRILRTK